MPVNYFKRFRMEIDLCAPLPELAALPRGYALIPWQKDLVEDHADVKFRSFRWEVDAIVFPCLGDYDGSLKLMQEISRRDGFLPAATWLAVYQPEGTAGWEPCGTIQGICGRHQTGAIQNVGVTPEHRERGVAAALISHSLLGFQAANVRRVHLEVTAENQSAVRLYQRLGFRCIRTVYKAVDVVYS